MAFARMLQHALIKPTDKVLVVGAGTGYGAAVIATLSARTVALECDPVLAAAGAAEPRWHWPTWSWSKGRSRPAVAAEQPYDVIIAEGRIEEVPQAWLDQLAQDGRLVAVVGDRGHGAGLRLFEIGRDHRRAQGVRCLGRGTAGVEEETARLRVLKRRPKGNELEW